MPIKLSLLAFKDGYKVSGTVESEDFTDATAQYENLKAYAEKEGWESGSGAAAAKVFGPQVTQLAPGGIACQFDGTPCEAYADRASGKEYSAQDIARGRAEKMGKMGLAPAPVCGPCWKSKGLADKWRAFYASQSSRY